MYMDDTIFTGQTCTDKSFIKNAICDTMNDEKECKKWVFFVNIAR